MKSITINLSFYNQDRILREHVIRWNSWPPNILKNFSFCIIDDCSKNKATEVLKGIDFSNIDLSIYRVKQDLICNIAGVRNLSAKICKNDWMLNLDMDTLVSEDFARSILSLTNAPKGNCYKFNRKVNKNPFHKKNRTIHPAVCLIRVVDYWKVGGCEEDLVGHYGQTDPIFWYRAQGKLKVQSRKDIFLDYISEGESKINRDSSHNKNLFEQKRLDNSWSSDFIRFEWDKIY